MSSCYILLNKIILAYTHTHTHTYARVLYVVIHARRLQSAYANRCMALPRRLYLDAKINYSTHHAEAAADRRHAKNVRSSTR